MLDSFPIERMARQAFLLADIRATENFIDKLCKEYRRCPERELQFYFPDDDKFESSKLDGNFELEFCETPEVLVGNQTNCK